MAFGWMRAALAVCSLSLCSIGWGQTLAVSGRVLDPQGHPIAGAAVSLAVGSDVLARVTADDQGVFTFSRLVPGTFTLAADASSFVPVSRTIELPAAAEVDLQFRELRALHESIVITARTIEPGIDLRNGDIFHRTLFTRDDQVLQLLSAGIDAGQHEGGGKSLEIRRFGFNLDHGGVNGGLKVLLDGVSQNQGTQGHGQGYLGALKALTPELIQDVTIVNGPFSAEYGDFSGLGVVHILQRESLPETMTLRLQGGSYKTGRTFAGWSPAGNKVDSYVAYEGSYTNGPFQNPGRYRRDNVNANYTRSIDDSRKAGLRLVLGQNTFFSSGQLPIDLTGGGALDRFGYLDPTQGGRVQQGTLSAYYSKAFASGDSLRIDGFVGRSLFDLYSNFTYYLADPVRGDAFQQHDSRLQQGSNLQWIHLHHVGSTAATFTAGANFHDNQINVGLYPRQGRVPAGVITRAHAHVTNEAGYAQESLSFLHGRLLLSGGLRYDHFRYGLRNEIGLDRSGVYGAKRWQAKSSIAYAPSARVPIRLHLNYGRGINSVDARGVIQRPEQPRLAATDFYQAGTSSNFGRFSMSTDVFLIDHSNEQVYVPDDGSFEFKGPTRAYGFEAKTSFDLTRRISLNGGLTKIANAFYRGGDHRVYVDSAPHFVANAALTLSGWRGWSGSLRMRAINHYRLDGDDPSILAAGHTVFDVSIAKRVSHAVEFNVSVDNMTNRDYWETQNYFESRVTPTAPAIARIHATPAYPINVVAGLTFRFGAR